MEEALQRALDALGARRADVHVEILETPNAGFLGWIGARPARVRVERIVRRHGDVRELVEDLLRAMEIPAEVHVERVADGIDVRITTDGLDGLLIGRRGQTLAALQHVVGRLVSKEFGQNGRVQVDVGDYRQRRTGQLEEKARALAEKVKTTGREIGLEPMHASDRRTVHLALAEIRGIRTYTVGQGLHRSIVIAPGPRSS